MSRKAARRFVAPAAAARSATCWRTANSIPRADEIHVDARTILFAFAIASVAGLLFGLVPAWQAARTGVNDTLKAEGRGTSGARQRALGVFVVAEVALAMVLLVGASLLLATFAHLKRVDPGFEASRALVLGPVRPRPQVPARRAPGSSRSSSLPLPVPSSSSVVLRFTFLVFVSRVSLRRHVARRQVRGHGS